MKWNLLNVNTGKYVLIMNKTEIENKEQGESEAAAAAARWKKKRKHRAAEKTWMKVCAMANVHAT